MQTCRLRVCADNTTADWKVRIAAMHRLIGLVLGESCSVIVCFADRRNRCEQTGGGSTLNTFYLGLYNMRAGLKEQVQADRFTLAC